MARNSMRKKPKKKLRKNPNFLRSSAMNHDLSHFPALAKFSSFSFILVIEIAPCFKILEWNGVKLTNQSFEDVCDIVSSDETKTFVDLLVEKTNEYVFFLPLTIQHHLFLYFNSHRVSDSVCRFVLNCNIFCDSRLNTRYRYETHENIY